MIFSGQVYERSSRNRPRRELHGLPSWILGPNKQQRWDADVRQQRLVCLCPLSPLDRGQGQSVVVRSTVRKPPKLSRCRIGDACRIVRLECLDKCIALSEWAHS